MMSHGSDALQAGRNESLARRPLIANGMTGASPSKGKFLKRTGSDIGCRIGIERIVPDPDQPRKTFGTEADERLSESMRIRGQLVPILVRWVEAMDRYMVIDGGRRFDAAVKANLTELVCVVEDEANPDTILEMQLVANALREDVSPTEQARAWDRLMKSRGLEQAELAKLLGYAPGTITKKVALLRLPQEIQQAVDAGEVKAETAYFMTQVEGTEQADMFEQAKAGTMTRDDARERVARSKVVKRGGKSKAKPKVVTTRTFRGQGGLRLTAERAKGLDPLGLVEALRSFADEVEANSLKG